MKKSFTQAIVILAVQWITLPTSITNGQNNEEVCWNARNQFKVAGQKQSCKTVQRDRSLCYAQKKYRKKCPALCGECECKNIVGRFDSVVKGRISCQKVERKKEFMCNDRDARRYCPATCNMCADSLTLSPSEAPKNICSVKAELSFPGIGQVNSYGVQNASMVVMKGNDDEACDGGITDWGCLHSGTAGVSKSPTGEGDYSTSEFIQIVQGADGTFTFQIQQTSDGLDHGGSGVVPSKLAIEVNGEPRASYRHTAYDQNHLIVSVKCDGFCNCMIEKEEACSLLAELKYPDDPEIYGYHKDDLNVTKLGSDEECNKNSTQTTSWGCQHTGDAVIWNPEDVTYSGYYNYNFREIVDIPNLYSSTIYLDVNHWFHQYYESYYEDDHMIQAELWIYIDGVWMKTFNTPKNPVQDTHNADGSVNENYKTGFRATVVCDDECNCSVSKKNF